jgi:hypothetical protein
MIDKPTVGRSGEAACLVNSADHGGHDPDLGQLGGSRFLDRRQLIMK